MNRTRLTQSIKILLILCWVPFGTIALGAEQSKFQEACKTFGGTYEETQKGCDPDCVTTYACKFADGTGRACDDKGKCGPLGSAAAMATPDSDSGTTSGSYSSPHECADAQHDQCEDQCSGKSGREALMCVRSCLNEGCGDVHGSSQEGLAGTGSGSSTSEGCRAQCPDKCAHHRGRKKRRCTLECERHCS